MTFGETLLLQPPSLYTIKGIVILDQDGHRLISKYYDDTFPTSKDQKAFEKKLFSKTSKSTSEIVLLEGVTVVYRSSVDLFLYVFGSSDGNELMINAALNTLFDALSLCTRKQLEKRILTDNMEAVFLIVDELCDGGVLLESDANVLAAKAYVRNDDFVNVGEQSVAQVLQNAKEGFKWGNILK